MTDAPRLPVLGLAARCYRDLLAHLRGFVAVAGLWIVLPPAAMWLAVVALPAPAASAAVLAAALLVPAGATAVAVKWHRHVILDEPLDPPMAPFGARALRYVLWTFVVSLLSGVPMLLVLGPAALALGWETGTPEGAAALPAILASAAVAAAAIAAVVVFCRLALVLPGVAVGDGTMTLGRSWRLMRGNVLRFIGGSVLVMLPVLLCAAAVTLVLAVAALASGAGGADQAEAIAPTGPAALLDLVGAAADLVLQFVAAVVYAAFLSSAYEALAGVPDRARGLGAG